MEKISYHLAIAQRIVDYGTMSDEELKGTYRIKCGQLNEDLDKLKEEGLIPKPGIKKADKDNPPKERTDLIQKLINFDMRIFSGRLLDIMANEGDSSLKKFVAGGI